MAIYRMECEYNPFNDRNGKVIKIISSNNIVFKEPDIFKVHILNSLTLPLSVNF